VKRKEQRTEGKCRIKNAEWGIKGKKIGTEGTEIVNFE
jgi:hypothetical protein